MAGAGGSAPTPLPAPPPVRLVRRHPLDALIGAVARGAAACGPQKDCCTALWCSNSATLLHRIAGVNLLYAIHCFNLRQTLYI